MTGNQTQAVGSMPVDVAGATAAPLQVLDHHDLEWERVRRATLLLHQRLRYEYPAPIHHLRHRLVLVPRERHGAQRRLEHRVVVAGASALVSSHVDEFGNHVVDVRASSVPRAIEFEVWAVVVHDAAAGPERLPAAALADRRLLEPTPLTRPDDAVAQVARRLADEAGEPLALARRINTWVHTTMTYAHGATDVRTTAAEALGLGRGVCQDYAHLMLSLCRSCGLPARYVSGHLLGEGGSHAWVEVVVPDSGPSGRVVAVPFDPTHGREAGASYLTVAVGRDYADVAPTSGTFRAPCRGEFWSGKRLGVTAADLDPAVASA